MITKPDWKTVTLTIGGAVGLITGLAAAYLIIKNREQNGEPLKLTKDQGAKIGMGIVSFLKMISESAR